MNNQLIQDLDRIVQRKLELFESINQITLAQQQDIENNQADNIEALVEQKQQVIDKIDKLDESFLIGYKRLKEDLKLDRPDKIDTVKYPELITIKASIEKIMAIASQIMELENSNRDKLNKIYDDVKNELRQINAGKRSLKAYETAPVYNDGVYIDKKK